MRQANSLAVLVLGILVGCAAQRALVVPPARAQPAHRWEYTCADASGAKDVNAMVSKFGQQGWELVAAAAKNSPQFNEDPTWCFKREVQ